MALVSPGVEVTIIDQSQYLPAASSSVPLVVLATAQNKANAAGTGVAAATTAANANKLYQVTSQRDLVNLFGTPFFYKTTNGTSIQGYELNEYGLLATYSLLGATNRCYVLRADIDLGSLVGSLSRPLGNPADGTYWLDTTNSTWGIYEFNRSTGKFVNQTPIVITDSEYIVDSYPVDSLGNVGSYAVIAKQLNDGAGQYDYATYFYKNWTNAWVPLGSTEWKEAVPVVTGTVSNPTLTNGDTFTININGLLTVTITIGSGDTVNDVANSINGLNITYLSARLIDNKLSVSYSEPNSSLTPYLTFAEGINTPLADMGIQPTQYYVPETVFSTSANMPLWTASQLYPHPTGSVWVKTSELGSGINLQMSAYNTATDTWVSKTVNKYQGIYSAISDLSSTGGGDISVGTVIATYGTIYTPTSKAPTSSFKYWEKTSIGSSVFTGSINNPTLTGDVFVGAIVTNVSGNLSSYQLAMSISGPATATDFVTNWLAAGIPNTTASVTASGAIQLEHTLGGAIYLTDFLDGQSTGTLAEAGFGFTDAGSTYGFLLGYVNNSVSQDDTTGSGSGATFSIANDGVSYTAINKITSGIDYAVNNLVTFKGSDLGGEDGGNDLTIIVKAVSGSGAIVSFAYYSGTPRANYTTQLSTWSEIMYTANEGAPATNPVNGTNWYYSTASEVDIMVNKDGAWYGYRNVEYDSTGNPAAGGSNTTDPAGPIISPTEPDPLTGQSDGTALEYGDLWIDSGDLENYPKLYRWEEVDGTDQWVSIDTSDQTSHNGILFADARWGNVGTVDPVNDPLVSIETLLESDYLDLDAPDPALYPQGMLLFNTRRSGYNVKQFKTNYFTSANYPSPAVLPTYSYTWVSVSGLQSNGAAYMGRKAQRNLVVQSIKAAIGTNQSIREEDTFFNLIAAPGYPELQPDMVTLNNDRNNTAYIIGDTPLRLPDQATDLTNWATNAAGATSTGEEGWVTRDSYLGVFYPSGITTDLTGAAVVVPASHMMLRTFLRNDSIAYPWLAPAGTRRGTIDNATNIGYLNATTGEFQTVKNRMSIRDVLYTNQINPLAYFTGVGLLNYGNKNSFDSQSALDRINVARLVCYIRERLQIAARPFVFEPNDAVTRNEISGVVQSLFVDLVAKRGLYDYLVVCDESNNTPARIDRNELWIDVAIEPVKAAEFIYIPVRVLNTGELANAQ
jgi:hypothetical protein